jgi:polysaccharide biosynthesis protein PslH
MSAAETRRAILPVAVTEVMAVTVVMVTMTMMVLVRVVLIRVVLIRVVLIRVVLIRIGAGNAVESERGDYRRDEGGCGELLDEPPPTGIDVGKSLILVFICHYLYPREIHHVPYFWKAPMVRQHITVTSARRELIYLSPIVPAPTGNGLAMRGYLFVRAASSDFDVKVLVVPVAGLVGEGQPGFRPSFSGRGRAVPAVTVLPPPSPGQLRSAVPALLADPAWRLRIAAAYPLPWLARRAPATLANAAIGAVGAAGATPVHVARSYLAPLGIAIAEMLGSPWVTLDLDDDDQSLARSLGDTAEADSYRRLVGVFGPLFSAVTLAAPDDGAAITERHGFPTVVIPNAVGIAGSADGRGRPGRPGQRGDQGLSLLFVGNLSYQPNIDAASSLVQDVLPRLQQLLGEPVTVTLVGPLSADGTVAALGGRPGVRVTGFVPDLEIYYSSADAVVAPLTAGSGTRIKLLEALAHGLPVVTSSAGAAGLDVHDGVHLLIANSPDETARAVFRLAHDHALGERLGGEARRLVRRRYSHEAVIPRIREFLASAAAAR